MYGYQGGVRRPNLFYLDTGEVLWHTAALGVVYNKLSDSQRIYSNHTDDITALALSPNKQIVATGQVT